MAKKKAKKKAASKKRKVVAKKKVSKKKASKKKSSKKKAKKKAAGAKPPTKSEIMSYIAEDTELSKSDVAAVFDSLSDLIEKNVGGRAAMFNMPGLFKIKRVNVKAKPKRWGKNPFTQEEQWFKAKPATKKVKILPLKGLKEMV